MAPDPPTPIALYIQGNDMQPPESVLLAKVSVDGSTMKITGGAITNSIADRVYWTLKNNAEPLSVQVEDCYPVTKRAMHILKQAFSFSMRGIRLESMNANDPHHMSMLECIFVQPVQKREMSLLNILTRKNAKDLHHMSMLECISAQPVQEREMSLLYICIESLNQVTAKLFNKWLQKVQVERLMLDQDLDPKIWNYYYMLSIAFGGNAKKPLNITVHNSNILDCRTFSSWRELKKVVVINVHRILNLQSMVQVSIM